MLTSRKFLTTALILVAWAISIAAARLYWHDPELIQESRLQVINGQLNQASSGQVMLIGDSTAERFHFPTLCGLDVVNVGIGRATVAEIEPLALQWIADNKPSVIIVSAGKNDANDVAASAHIGEALNADYIVPPSFGNRPDGKHLTADSYRELRNLIEAELCPSPE